MSGISRRDFLKLASALGGGVLLSNVPRALQSLARLQNNRPNIIILVFDTMSARNLSLYGYPRETTPNLRKFADRATVYHSHISGASFTTPGTASILMGMYPWKHRAINQAGLIKRELLGSNIFRAVGNGYYRLGFAQNLAADLLLGQFDQDMEWHIPLTAYSMRGDTLVGDKFKNDSTLALSAYEDFLLDLKIDPGLPGSLLMGLGYKSYFLDREDVYRYDYPDYPLGLPIRKDISLSFLNETVYDGLRAEIENMWQNQRPFFAYLHLWSPHEPYRPRKDYLKLFQGDGYNPVDKPKAPLGGGVPAKELRQLRNNYDRYIANVDGEIGRLLRALDEKGVLENSYVVLTSDHGQLFERGVHGHISPYLYDPGVRIPLLISRPGQSKREDVYSLTSSADLLPTLLHFAGREIPADCEGQLLPGLDGEENDERSVFSVEAKLDSAFGPLKKQATFTMYKGDYKLIYYTGYPGSEDFFELYNLREDIEELRDLTALDQVTFKRYKDELLDAVEKSNHAL